MNLWWYVARASGIIAWVMLAAAVIWGVLFATRFLGSRVRPAWTLDLHRWLGGLSVTFTGVHVAGLMLDDYVEFGAREILVPMASEWRPTAVAWGIVAAYLLIAVQATSLVMKRLPRRLWKWVHMTSFGMFFVASMHAGLAGTDVGNRLYLATAMLVVMSVVFASAYRVVVSRTPAPSAPVRPPDQKPTPADV